MMHRKLPDAERKQAPFYSGFEVVASVLASGASADVPSLASAAGAAADESWAGCSVSEDVQRV